MLKSIAKNLILIFLMTATLSFAQHLELETLTHWELHGAVHTVIERNINVTEEDGKTVETPNPSWSQKTFSEQGLLLENIVYRDDEVIKRLVLSYNKAGQLVELVSYLGDYIEFTERRTYDENGIWMKTTEERGGKTSIVSINKQYLDFDPLALEHSPQVYTLNENGQPAETLSYQKSRGRVHTNKRIFTYNDQGDLIEKRLVDGETDKLLGKLTYIVESGRVIEEYDEPVDYSAIRRVYTYDEYGNLLEIKEYSVDGYSDKPFHEESYSYDYDAEGNWIKKTRSEEMQVERIDIREITYY